LRFPHVEADLVQRVRNFDSDVAFTCCCRLFFVVGES
jgi:hypothetical protein